MSRAKATIGIDLGGTRMRVGRFDDSGALRAERTASPATADEGVARLAELARELEDGEPGRATRGPSLGWPSSRSPRLI